MAKKKKDSDQISDLAIKKFFEQIDDVEKESRASDIGVVEDMYRYEGEPGQEAPASAAGEATGNGGPAGAPVPEPPEGGPGGGDAGSRPAGRRRSARPPRVSAEDDQMQRMCLIGADVGRLRMLLYLLKMKNKKGSNATILLEYLDRGVRKDFPELAGIADALASGGAGR